MSSAKKLLSSVRMKQMAGVNLPHLRTVTIPTRAVLAQYKEIQHSMPSGMFVIPDETRFRVWHGVLFVPPGVTFAHHVITFTLTIADNFPAEGAAPTIVFQQWPPHPLVQPGTGLFALEHFIPLWTVQMPLSLALKAVKRAFVPTGRDLERMCFSTSTLDPRTAEGMSKDLEGMLAMVEGLAKKSHENVLTEDDSATGAGGGARRARLAPGGFTFTRPKPGHDELMRFLAEKTRSASEICEFVRCFEAGEAGAAGPRTMAGAAASPAAARPARAAAAAAQAAATTPGSGPESAAAAGAAAGSAAATP
ncbi:hypothetical protein FNF31_04971 [Cafeteria roenbergensis]|nr:hypothetical protein FNF31_04971 [Cafeteria roenbergensis]